MNVFFSMFFYAGAALAATRGEQYTLAAATASGIGSGTASSYPADFAKDGAWVNVDRWATNICAARKCGPMDASNCLHIEYPYSEGLGGVFIGKPGKPELEGCTPSGCAPMHYGCWFTMIPPVGQRSGAAVNVGKSLRANNRTEVARMLHVPCNGGANKDCDVDVGLILQDAKWCSKAQEQGFDSIQVRNPHFINHDTELVVCTGCVSAPLDGACPPIPLKRGDWDPKPGPCVCNNAADNLNCGDHEKLARCLKNTKAARQRISTLTTHASHAVNTTEKAQAAGGADAAEDGSDPEDGDDDNDENFLWEDHWRKCGAHQCRMVPTRAEELEAS
jgi:hypothetical protein